MHITEVVAYTFSSLHVEVKNTREHKTCELIYKHYYMICIVTLACVFCLQ